MGKRRFTLGPLVVGFLLAASFGCGPGRGDLSGKITFQGKLLRFGTVSVLGNDGMPRSGLINDNGTYVVNDIRAGSVKVAITSADPGESQPAQRIPGTPKAKVDRTGWFPIPEKYADFSTSGLTFVVTSGANTWDIDLK